MSSGNTLNVAMVGHGFMGAAHSQGWRTAPAAFELPARPRMELLVGRSAPVADAADRWGWSDWMRDWREALRRDDIDVVDIVTPGDSHAEIAVAALEAGKHVICEKPLASTVEEAESMAEAAERAAGRGVRAMVGFTYRRVPAVAFARNLIAEGRIGTVRQVRAAYRQDWLVDTQTPMSWRLQREEAGSGALGDIGSHAVDLVQHLVGARFSAVSGTVETRVPRRPSVDGGIGEVTVDDLAMVTGRLDTGDDAGPLVSLEASRLATGRKNALEIEISGDRGALRWELEDLNTLWLHEKTGDDVREGFRRILVTEQDHPYVEGWWPPGHLLGYEHGFSHQVRDFVHAVAEGEDPAPSFAAGLHVQRVLDAVEVSSRGGSRWVDVRGDHAPDRAQHQERI